MVEQIMFVGIGFLIAGLLVSGVIPLVHARAVRLTMRRLEALTPMSIAEIQDDKDQLRPEFAMTMSRLEMNVEQMKAKSSNQLADLGRKSEAIGRLKLELGEKTAALFALEAKEKQLSDDLQTTQTELAAKTGAFEEAERALASARTELTQVTANFNDTSVASGSQRVEVVALRAQTEALKGQIDSYEKETKALWDHLNTKTAELEAANQQLAEERSRTDNLASRAGELGRQLTAQTAESEVLGGRVQELAARLDEQGRLPADGEGFSQNLRDEATTAQKTETEIRTQLAEMEDRHRLALATIKTETSLIETELKRSQDERDKLQREMAAVKRDAANAGEYERMENAVLREHIDELTAALEGPDSPIETILNAGRAGAPAGNGPLPPIAARAGESKGTLADRIRTLQARASRGAPAQRGPKRGAVPRGARADK